jgi:hypothetical protein
MSQRVLLSTKIITQRSVFYQKEPNELMAINIMQFSNILLFVIAAAMLCLGPARSNTSLCYAD